MPAPSGLAVSAITDTTARLGWTPVAPEKWRLTVTTTGASQDYTVDINAGTTPNIDIDWGDGGAVENFTTTGQKNHTFTSAGTYTVKISGSFASGGNIRLGSNSGNRERLKATGAVPLISGLLNFYSTFQSCAGITSVSADVFRYNPQVSTSGFYQTFYGCTGLTAIPTDLFRYNVNVSTSGFYLTFYNCTSLTAIPTDLFRYNVNVSTNGFYGTFNLCTGLTSIPTDLFRYNVNVSTNGFISTFYGCTGLTSIPTDLFRYNVNVSTNGFISTFNRCTGLTAIPTDLFRYNVNVSTSGFYATFYNCTSLTAIPTDLFRYNVNVSTSGFYATFYNCTSLTAIPTDLFRYNVAVSSDGFNQTFSGCNKLISIPTDLFRYNVNVINAGFRACFSGCSLLTTIPADLFRYNTNLGWLGFYETFSGCSNLQLVSDLFGPSTELNSRFLDRILHFQDAFKITSFTGTKGTAPALWNYDYGNVIELGVSPTTDWAADDVITGQSSGATCVVVSKVNATSYRIKQYFGTFTLGEVIGVTGDANKLADQGATRPTFLETLVLDVSPATAWAVGDVITGQTSGATSTVVSQYNSTTYTVKLRSATYTLGEIIGVTGVTAKLADQGTSRPIFYRVPLSTTCFNGHSTESVDNYADIPAEWR